MKWELKGWLKMSELFIGIMIFAVHAMAAVWWSSTSHIGWKTLSVLTTTCLCGPLVPHMFRFGPYLYSTRELVKPINVFIIIYCFVSYVVGCFLVIVDTYQSRQRFIVRNVDIVAIFGSATVSVIFFVDLIFTLKYVQDDEEDDD